MKFIRATRLHIKYQQSFVDLNFIKFKIFAS